MCELSNVHKKDIYALLNTFLISVLREDHRPSLKQLPNEVTKLNYMNLLDGFVNYM